MARKNKANKDIEQYDHADKKRSRFLFKRATTPKSR